MKTREVFGTGGGRRNRVRKRFYHQVVIGNVDPRTTTYAEFVLLWPRSRITNATRVRECCGVVECGET